MGFDGNIENPLLLNSKDQTVSSRELIAKVTAQRYCLNNALMATKLKKLRNGRALLEKTNRQLSEMAKKHCPACKSGCSFCCQSIFKVSSLELEVISFHLINNPLLLDAFLNNYIQRQKDLQEEMQQLYERYTNGSSEEQREVSFRYFEKGIPCAFLNQQGGCMIYEVRPIVCAGFISADAAQCSKSPASGSIPPEMHRLFTETNMKLHAASKKLGDYADLSTMIFRHLIDLAGRGAKSVML